MLPTIPWRNLDGMTLASVGMSRLISAAKKSLGGKIFFQGLEKAKVPVPRFAIDQERGEFQSLYFNTGPKVHFPFLFNPLRVGKKVLKPGRDQYIP